MTKAITSTAFRPWRVLHVDLEKRLGDLEAEPACGGVYLVLWWRGIPLGELSVAAEQLPVPAGHIRALAASAVAPAVGSRLFGGASGVPLPFGRGPRVVELADLVALERPRERLSRTLHEGWDRTRERAVPVSVVVCTRDRSGALARCLGSVRRSSMAPHEIIVVDNAPATDETRELVAGMRDVHYVCEPRRGLSAARNAGVRRATGELIAFTDDDVVLDGEWLARLCAAFDDPRVMCVTGLVLPATLDTESEWFFERTFGGFAQGFKPSTFDERFLDSVRPEVAPVWRIGAGANMAFRRRLFDLVGPFDERLGAGASGCSEDSELWYRTLVAGGTCRYEPAAVAHHHHRSDPGELERQMHEYVRGHVAALLVQYERHRDPGNLRRLLAVIPRHYLRRVWRRLVHGAQPEERMLRAELAGYLSGVAFYLRASTSASRRAATRAPAGGGEGSLADRASVDAPTYGAGSDRPAGRARARG